MPIIFKTNSCKIEKSKIIINLFMKMERNIHISLIKLKKIYQMI